MLDADDKCMIPDTHLFDIIFYFSLGIIGIYI